MGEADFGLPTGPSRFVCEECGKGLTLQHWFVVAQGRPKHVDCTMPYGHQANPVARPGGLVAGNTTTVNITMHELRSGSPRYYELLEKMADLHARKNQDYSPGADPFRNFRASEKIGIPAFQGAWVRAQDKYERVCSLIARLNSEGATNPTVIDESLEDTLLDGAVYMLLVLCLYEEYREAEQKKLAGRLRTMADQEGEAAGWCG